MPKFISDSDMDRITEFAKTPVYKRTPEQLMPESDDDEQERDE